MSPKRNIPLLAFLVGCFTSIIATFGFLLEGASRTLSLSWSIGYDLSYIGALGFAVGAMFTGGHQATSTSIAVSGTILNLSVYFLSWLAILKVIQAFRRKAH